MWRSPAHRLVPVASAVACAIVAFLLLASIHAFERFSAFAGRHESWQLDDAALAVALSAILGAVVLAFRRGRALAAARVQLERAEPARVVCMVCGGDELGAARPLVSAVASHDTGTSFTHTVCASCLAELERSPAV